MKQLPQLKSLEGEKKKKTRKPADKIAYARAIAKGKSKTEAALIATGSTTRKSASVAAARIEKDLTLKDAIATELARQGNTLETAIRPITKALKHYDIDVNLKGSDRYFKLIGAFNNDGGGNTFNFVQITNTDKNQYAL